MTYGRSLLAAMLLRWSDGGRVRCSWRRATPLSSALITSSVGVGNPQPARQGVDRTVSAAGDKMIGALGVGFLLGLLSFVAIAIPSVAAKENLIEDGGFELNIVDVGGAKLGLGVYGAWTSPTPGSCSGSTEILGLPLPRALGRRGQDVLPAYEGDEAMNLGPCYGDGSIIQGFKTEVGARYTVSLAVFGGAVTATVFNGSKTDLVAVFVALDGASWWVSEYSFTASSADTIIRLQNKGSHTQTCCASTVDDVRIVSVGEGS